MDITNKSQVSAFLKIAAQAEDQKFAEKCKSLIDLRLGEGATEVEMNTILNEGRKQAFPQKIKRAAELANAELISKLKRK